MILGKIQNLNVDSSLLRKIDLDCIKGKCNHNACCYESVQLTEQDIIKINKISKESILKRINDPFHKKIFSSHRFYDIDKKIKFFRAEKDEWSRCIFMINNKCILEEMNPDHVPIFCRSFPVIIKGDEIQVVDFKINCLKEGLNPAYKSLKKEIILLTSPEIYSKLTDLLSKYEGKINYFLVR